MLAKAKHSGLNSGESKREKASRARNATNITYLSQQGEGREETLGRGPYTLYARGRLFSPCRWCLARRWQSVSKKYVLCTTLDEDPFSTYPTRLGKRARPVATIAERFFPKERTTQGRCKDCTAGSIHCSTPGQLLRKQLRTN